MGWPRPGQIGGYSSMNRGVSSQLLWLVNPVELLGLFLFWSRSQGHHRARTTGFSGQPALALCPGDFGEHLIRHYLLRSHSEGEGSLLTRAVVFWVPDKRRLEGAMFCGHGQKRGSTNPQLGREGKWVGGQEQLVWFQARLLPGSISQANRAAQCIFLLLGDFDSQPPSLPCV